jgi:protein-S-isoprenylcysteine O-methyltransferase Ste14
MLDESPGNVRPAEDKSIGDLFGDLARELGTLVRQEIQLAKVEMSDKASRAAREAGKVAAGGALVHAGLLAVIAAVILALGTLIPLWVSALVVGLLVLAIGGSLAKSRLAALKRIDPAPRQTMETLKEDARWARERAQ